MADTSLAAALGTTQRFGTFQGRTISLEEWDLNDIADVEDQLGASIDTLNPMDTKHMRLVLWLALRRADETLTPEDRRECRYRLTVAQVGRRVKASAFMTPEVLSFVAEVMKASGLYNAPEPDSGNADGGTPKPKVRLGRARRVPGRSMPRPPHRRAAREVACCSLLCMNAGR